jgi:hypothetical protein
MFDTPIVTFKKTGGEIKNAVKRRKQALQQRLDGRNKALDHFMKNPTKVRSYLIRSSRRDYDMHTGRGYALQAHDGVSSEEIQDITQLCQRILEIEGEIYRLAMAETHLRDEEAFELTLEDLIGYGFDAKAS